MGFNLQGIAISKKYESANELAEVLELGEIKKVSDSTFEDASSFMSDEKSIYFTKVENGTIITLGFEIEIEEIPLDFVSSEGKALRFLISETAMAFGFEYFVNGELTRTVMAVNEDIVSEEGEPLEIEETEEDIMEIIIALIEDVTGDSLYSIEPDQKSEFFIRD